MSLLNFESLTWRMRSVLALACALLPGCDSGPTTTGPDSLSPTVRVLSPAAGSYDDDGDGLIDLRLEWQDSLGAVDPTTLRVRVIGANAPAGAETNLLSVWRVARLDATGLVAEETAAGLLGAGIVRLEVQLADTAGNIARDTVSATLPEAILAGTLVTGVPVGFQPAYGLALCPDDGRLYVAVRSSVLVVDPDSLRAIALVTMPGTTTENLWNPLCVPGDPYVYFTETRIQRFSRSTMMWEARMASTFASIGIALSRANPDLIYEGESYSGVVGVISRSQDTRRRLLQFASQETHIFDLAVMPNDAKIYLGYGVDDGIWVLDPARDSVLKRISIGGMSFAGFAQDMVLSRDDRRLYAVSSYGTPPGVVEIDTDRDSVLRRLDLPNYNPVGIDLSPDGSRLFVTTQDRFNNIPSENVLIDVASMTPIRFFPRPRPAGTTRYDRGVLFRPDGKYIFVARDSNLDIYLHRQ